MAEIPFEPYTNQGKLRFWCQKVLPLVYDDSLSYYELLNKVVDYLNNTIDDVSACEDNITALRDAFVQLQNYVNEVLDDLDAEVESVIDEMINSGEFGEILSGVVNGLIASEYDPTQAYIQFAYCLKDGKLYCATASTTGEWDATKWRETTVGYDMQILNRRVFNLNAGQVAYDNTATYDNGTVGKKLKDIDDFNTNLNAGQVAYNSQSSYNNATVGKELQELKGSLNSMNHSITTWDVKTNGKLLFIGNSYAKYDSENWNKFPYWCCQYLGLGAENSDWYNIAQPSHCLAEGIILNDLTTWVNAQTTAVKNSIGAVILVAGINDSRGLVSGESSARYTQVPSRLAELATYIKANLPNAVMYNGYCGWIDLITRPTDDRRGAYRLKVAQAYMKSTQYGWKYLNGIENIIHNKNYLADGVHPNEVGAKRLGLALAQALTTGACEIIEWSTTLPTPPEGGSVGSNAKARERQQNGIINTQFNAFQFVFASNTTVNVGDLLVVGNINLNMSTGVVEFGNQAITLASYANSTWTEHGALARIFIADNGDITLQIKAFFDGSTSQTIRRVTSFIISESHAVYADDTWNNTIDSL